MNREQKDAVRLFVDRLLGQPARWGHSDCHLLCAGALDAAAATCVSAVFAGRYSDRSGAIAYQRAIDHLERVLLDAGMVYGHLPFETGDVLIRRHKDYDHCALVADGLAVLAVPGRAIARVPIACVSFDVLLRWP